jgi:hypothetical protein
MIIQIPRRPSKGHTSKAAFTILAARCMVTANFLQNLDVCIKIWMAAYYNPIFK